MFLKRTCEYCLWCCWSSWCGWRLTLLTFHHTC